MFCVIVEFLYDKMQARKTPLSVINFQKLHLSLGEFVIIGNLNTCSYINATISVFSLIIRIAKLFKNNLPQLQICSSLF